MDANTDLDCIQGSLTVGLMVLMPIASYIAVYNEVPTGSNRGQVLPYPAQR